MRGHILLLRYTTNPFIGNFLLNVESDSDSEEVCRIINLCEMMMDDDESITMMEDILKNGYVGH